MQYIGNDIVAYKHKRCLGKWKDDFFIKKILTPNEQILLHQQTNKDAYLWALWTIKEAAYKLSCFLGNRNKFHAIQFETNLAIVVNDDNVHETETFPCSLPENKCQLLGSFIFSDLVFYTQTFITHQFVHSTVSNINNGNNVINKIGIHQNYNKNDFSKEVRLFTIEHLKNQNIFVDEIKKDIDGIPFINVNNTDKYISLSHDQQFVSFAFV